jgi:1-phosphofructokinase
LNNKAKVIVDTTGEALTATLKYKPFLIKPNNHELSEIFGVEIATQEDIIVYAKKLLEMGAENVIVSMAGEGALLICGRGFIMHRLQRERLKSVGAGDSLIGGFLANYSKSLDLTEAFRWGVASGSATAFSLDLCTKDEVEKLLVQIKVTKLI